jgi:hypothetical protein
MLHSSAIADARHDRRLQRGQRRRGIQVHTCLRPG